LLGKAFSEKNLPPAGATGV
jgi:hypothetical protein